MRLVIQGSRAPAPLADLALIKAIARGRLWSDDLLAGRVASVAVIAKREGVLPNYVRRLIRLAFLAPKIVEAIAAGHQPPELTAKALTERIELPLLLNEQERAVVINNPARARDFRTCVGQITDFPRISNSPHTGADGTIYAGSYDHNLYAVNPNGTQKWAFATGNAVESFRRSSRLDLG